MFKKNIFKNLSSRYNSHAYSGLMGFFMKKCHEDLEKFKFQNKISKILEIGAGTEPHYKYIKHDYDEYFILETSEDIEVKDYKNPKISITNYNGKKYHLMMNILIEL